MCEKYLGDGALLVKNDQQKSVSEAISPSVKLIFLYFSKHDCAPCLEFTPVFAELYNEQTDNEQT